MTKNIKKIIPAQAAPILVIVFALVTLIGGGYFVWGHGTGGVPGSITPADPWANDVEWGAHSGEPLTAAKWNSLVNRLSSLGSGGQWKLLAKSDEVTEAGNVTFSSGGVTVTETNTRGGMRHDPFFLGWPSSAINEIMFYVVPVNVSFCVGGRALACSAECTDYWWNNANGLQALAGASDAWLFLTVNGTNMVGCPSVNSSQAPFPAIFDGNHPGKLAKLNDDGDPSSATCRYAPGAAVTSIGVQSNDCIHPHRGAFRFEIWYR